ncbi:hypothetical protein MPSEU_000812400 [Mayamaea pseudoterrestris]|nr:hypothetical protein MPSEU_000812400 [Mayamaea pseudoterrestris]
MNLMHARRQVRQSSSQYTTMYLYCSLLLIPAVILGDSFVTAWLSSTKPRLVSGRFNAINDLDKDANCHVDGQVYEITGRRQFFDRSLRQLSIGILGTASLQTAAASAADSPAATLSVVSRDRIASLLHVVPTFTIVDPNGVPYMVVGEDAKVTGYFFTEYEEANRILKLARASTDKAIREQRKEQAKNKRKAKDETAAAATIDEELIINPWKDARISTVPLDFAVTLVTRSTSGSASNNYFQVSPSTTDIDDALAATNKTDLAEGKVPLFYYEDFTVANGSETPLYFRKSELQASFRREHASRQLPPLLVTELFSVLAKLVTSDDAELKTLVFVPPQESLKKAAQCQSDVPFVLGQRIIVL